MTFLVLPRMFIDIHIHEINKINILFLNIFAFINRLKIKFDETNIRSLKLFAKIIILCMFNYKVYVYNLSVRFGYFFGFFEQNQTQTKHYRFLKN